MKINIGDYLARRARGTPEAEAVVDLHTGRRLSFKELDERSCQCANALSRLGVAKGDRVALFMKNSVEYLQLVYGVAKIGAVLAPLNWRLVGKEVAFLIQDLEAKVVFHDPEFGDLIAQVREDCDSVVHWIEALDSPERDSDQGSLAALCELESPAQMPVDAGDDDLLMIMYTSGTTGRPKGSMHTHRSLAAVIETVIATIDFSPSDRFLMLMPLFHIGALGPALINVYVGSTTVLDVSFEPARFWRYVQEERITFAQLVPAMLLVLREHFEESAQAADTLRWILCGAAPVPIPLIQSYSERGIQILQVYGLTESGGPACVLLPEEAMEKAGSTGKPMFHTDVRIVDGNGSPCGPGEAGEICVRGRHIMAGYWQLEEASAKTIVDGWVHSGDVGVLEEGGYLTIVDRLKDMLISGGENVYPAEIESVLLSVEGVAEAAVIGATSQKWGESPVAFVVRSSAAVDEDLIKDRCSRELAPFKRVASVEFVDALPRTATGKVQKDLLRDQVASWLLA